MLDLAHILGVLKIEWQSYNASIFFSSGLFMWMAHKVSNLSKSEGGKVFWMMLSLLILIDVLESDKILFDYKTYVAIAIFFTHFDLITKPIKAFRNVLKQRAYNKYRTCVERNEYIENLEKKEKREEEKLDLEQRKQKQQERFINELSKKLDSF